MATESPLSGTSPRDHLDSTRLAFWGDVDLTNQSEVAEFLAAIDSDRSNDARDLASAQALQHEYQHLMTCQMCSPQSVLIASLLANATRDARPVLVPESLTQRRDAIAAALAVFDDEHRNLSPTAPTIAPRTAPTAGRIAAKRTWWRRGSAGSRSMFSGPRGSVGGSGRGSVLTPTRALATAAALSLVTGLLLLQQRRSNPAAVAPITEAASATEPRVQITRDSQDAPVPGRAGELASPEAAPETETANGAAPETEAAAESDVASGVAEALDMATAPFDPNPVIPTPATPPATTTTTQSTTPPQSTTRPITRSITPATKPSAVQTKATSTPVGDGAQPVTAEPVFDDIVTTTRPFGATRKKAVKRAAPAAPKAAGAESPTGASATASASAVTPSVAVVDLGDLGVFNDVASASDAVRKTAAQRGTVVTTTIVPTTAAAPFEAASATTVFAAGPANTAAPAASAAPFDGTTASGMARCPVPGARAVGRVAIAGRVLFAFVTGSSDAPTVVIVDSRTCTIVP